MAKRILLGILAFIVVAVLAAALYIMSFATQLGKEFGLANSELSEQEQMAITEVLEASGDILESPFYMLLLGTDSRDLNNDGGRSDTCILVRVDPLTYTVSMVSVPRDSRVEIPGYWTTKFNAAYFYGGPALTIQTVTNITGVGIQHFAVVNFQTLITLVDDIGGIDVYVPADIDDWKAGDSFIPKGWNHIDGEQALMLARTRDWVGSDFSRQAFQRQIIKAIAEQVLTLPATEITSVVKRAAESVLTDLSFTDLFTLALHFRGHTEDMTFYSANLPATTGMVDDVSYVFLVEEDVRKMIRQFMAGNDPTDYEPSQWEYVDSPIETGFGVEKEAA